jgi:hypothetical protein
MSRDQNISEADAILKVEELKGLEEENGPYRGSAIVIM